MKTFVLSDLSKQKLRTVHPALKAVVYRAIELSTVDFTVLEGVRTIERQGELLRAGATTTMHSRHLAGVDGYSRAVDLGGIVDGIVRWDWPLYTKIAIAMKAASSLCETPIEWGGDWKKFKDGPHFQLPIKLYP